MTQLLGSFLSAAKAIIWIVGLLLIGVTLLPFVKTNEGWVRIWDFPRPQIAVLLGVVLAGAVMLFDLHARGTRLFMVMLVLALGYQGYRILPFTPLVPVRALAGKDCATDSRVGLLIANVRTRNRQSELLIDMVRATDPDLLLAIETDQWWERKLSVIGDAYPFVIRQPQDNTYGMHLYAKLELIDPQVRFLLDDYVPSIRTGVRLRSGALIDFYGVHPKPPRLSRDTDLRDAELLIIGREVRQEARPGIVAGDLNDVAWSQTTTLFQKVSGLLDPRIGRGLYPTYNAHWPVRWPIDHVFFEDSFTVLELKRKGYIGSDHFPIFVALCHQPAAAIRQDEPDRRPDDQEQATDVIREGRQEAQGPE